MHARLAVHWPTPSTLRPGTTTRQLPCTTPCDTHALKQVLFEGYVIGSGSTFGAIIAALGASCCDSQEQAQCAAP
eukprot:m.108779 g.108779  ORF g.108779 m.108779 type:complete len:75 (-) comp21230_c0_seq2:461-685(-)